ncbi:MAG: hypothetical protein QM586_02840 [Xenophilus sp.]
MRLALAALIAGAIAPAQAATIYLCKAYNGGTFWSQAHCSQHNALIERIESVADVPWNQQVEQAEARKQRAAPTRDYDRENRCDALYAELRRIEQRYERGIWQDVPIVNQDQARVRALRNLLSNNRCGMQ